MSTSAPELLASVGFRGREIEPIVAATFRCIPPSVGPIVRRR
jgi:hypothetical protein